MWLTNEPFVRYLTSVYHPFHHIIKFPLLKLSCTINHLCKGTSLQQLPLNFFDIDIPLASLPKITIYHFLRAGQQNKGKVAQSPYERIPLTNQPTPTTSHPPSIYNLSPAKAISMPIRTIMCCPVLLEENFPSFARNHFFIHSPCSSCVIYVTHPGHPTLSKQVTWNMEDLY